MLINPELVAFGVALIVAIGLAIHSAYTRRGDEMRRSVVFALAVMHFAGAGISGVIIPADGAVRGVVVWLFLGVGTLCLMKTLQLEWVARRGRSNV